MRGWGSLDAFNAERETRRAARAAVVSEPPKGQVLAFPGAVANPMEGMERQIGALLEAMSDEARADVMAYARCRLRRDRAP